jgi:hypothetical protein
MDKGALFLVLTIISLIAVSYFFTFNYERTDGHGQVVQTSDAPRGEVVADCEADLNCFLNAISECNIVTFLLPDPLNETNSFEGIIIGNVFDKCEVILEDPKSKNIMKCLLNEDSLDQISSVSGLKKVCSGELLDYLS